VGFVNIPIPTIGAPAASEPEIPQPPTVSAGDVNIIINAITGEPTFTFEDGTG
jgi:hypothetical protein